MPTCRLCLFVFAAFAPTAAAALNPVAWQIDVSTTGQDVFWTSPTAVTPGLALYDWSYEITKVTARVTVFGEQDITDQIGDARMGGGTEPGVPFVLLDEFVQEDTSGSSANFRIEVDAGGFGKLSVTDVTLGSYFGFRIERVDVEAAVSLLGIPHGDYDRDGDVDMDDYLVWKNDFGSTINLNADGNRDSIVGAADYTVWRDHLGTNTIGGSGSAATAVPEPASWSLAAALCALLGSSRPRKETAACGSSTRGSLIFGE